MTKCPLISYQKQYTTEIDCMGEDCMMWSANKDSCLIRLTLLQHTQDISSGKEETVEEKIKKLENQMNAVSLGFPTYPLGGGKIE